MRQKMIRAATTLAGLLAASPAAQAHAGLTRCSGGGSGDYSGWVKGTVALTLPTDVTFVFMLAGGVKSARGA